MSGFSTNMGRINHYTGSWFGLCMGRGEGGGVGGCPVHLLCLFFRPCVQYEYTYDRVVTGMVLYCLHTLGMHGFLDFAMGLRVGGCLF